MTKTRLIVASVLLTLMTASDAAYAGHNFRHRPNTAGHASSAESQGSTSSYTYHGGPKSGTWGRH